MDPATLTVRLLSGVAVFAGFYLLAWMADLFLGRLADAAVKVAEGRRLVFNLIRRASRAALLVLGAVCALGTFGVDVTALVAGLGLTGFALGFALKDALANLLAGALIIIYRPFVTGDRIKVSGCEGAVADINLRYVSLQADDGVEHLVPSSVCFTQCITRRARAEAD